MGGDQGEGFPVPDDGADRARRFEPRAAGRLVMLSAAMRAGGSPVGVSQLLEAHRALNGIDATDRAECYFALREVLCSGRADHEVFEAAFAEVFVSVRSPGRAAPIDELAAAVLDPESTAGDHRLDGLRERDLAEFGDAEGVAARELVTHLAEVLAAPPAQRAGRSRAGRRALTRARRSILREGGDPSQPHWRRARARPRRLVLVLAGATDLDPYSGMLLTYAHARSAACKPTDVFVASGGLERVTEAVRMGWEAGAGVREALGGCALEASDLAALAREHRACLGAEATVVILGGRCAPARGAELEASLAELAAACGSIVWLDPLGAASGGADAMMSAPPHVDRSLAGNSLASLERLAAAIEGGPR